MKGVQRSRKRYLVLVVGIVLLAGFGRAEANDFIIVNKTVKASIVYIPGEGAIDSIAANMLADDISRVTGYRPVVATSLLNMRGNIILIGSIQSTVIRGFLGRKPADIDSLNGQWERYLIKVFHKPDGNINELMLIAGSDRRGTAYGVTDISEKIGVSAWYWWADVHPEIKHDLILSQADFISHTPSVKYRGIFLNDEDWGLQPWAAKTFEPETGDIGPKTYAKIFELLLRLKANLIWPAMHPSTKAFYHYPGNKKVADDYAIIIGSSHAEPMLRNNVDEWNVKTMGPFNYITNKQNVFKYWEDRVKETSSNEVMYTLGMRGVHDSGIEGVRSNSEAVPLLQQIIADQRDLLKKYVNADVTKVAQAFTAYKEVLDIYDAGLRIPGDVILVWPDDNYGYIQRLNDEKEQLRTGGSGVYYHASYWGRPHDYLWLSTTHPALIREEMMKAYETGATQLWVLNVGDIKPLEYNIQLFMDMAWEIKKFSSSASVKQHLLNWNRQQFGEKAAKPVSDILWKYYQLAFERRPEFMGWSQTEPITQVSMTGYNHFSLGDEAQHRIDQYDTLERSAGLLRKTLPSRLADAYFELVYYPVVAASSMNKKFLYRDKSILYARQNRLSAQDYELLSSQAYKTILEETNNYNTAIAGGKWKGIMSMAPRKLPVFEDVSPKPAVNPVGTFGVLPEGYKPADSSYLFQDNHFVLPTFNNRNARSYFLDIFLTNGEIIPWRCTVSDPFIRLSVDSGTLIPLPGKKQVRLWVSINWDGLKTGASKEGRIYISGKGKTIEVEVEALRLMDGAFTGHVENNGFLSIYAAHFDRNMMKGAAKWQVWDDIGHTGSLLVSPLPGSHEKNKPDTFDLQAKAPYAEYDFYTYTAGVPKIDIISLPTQPLNRNFSMRFGVAIDDGPVRIVDFKTIGRSETWKQDVLSNSAHSIVQFPYLKNGKHKLDIYMIDPGVMLDRITIDLGGLPKAYSIVPETF